MRLGNTMSEAMMSMMVSSDSELKDNVKDGLKSIDKTRTKAVCVVWCGGRPEGRGVQEVGRTSPVDL